MSQAERTKLTCGVCERVFFPSHWQQLYCRRSCTVRAIDRRRRGLPISSPGFRGREYRVGDDLREVEKLLRAAAKRAEREGWDEVLMLIYRTLTAATAARKKARQIQKLTQNARVKRGRAQRLRRP